MTLISQQFNKLVTKKDLKKELKEFATKKELKKLEEKMDSKFDLAFDIFATKKDLEKFATRAFDMFASKEDLKELEKKVASKEDINRLFTLMDSIVGKHQEIETERRANIGAHDRIEEEITKTNKRVTIVEKKLEAVSVV